MSAPWDLRCDILQVESQVWRQEVSDAKKLKGLEDENRRLKKLLAEAMLDNAALKDLSEKTAKACGTSYGSCPAHRAPRAQPATRVQAGGN